MVRVKGKNEPVKIYELVSKRTDIPKNIIEGSEMYQDAFKSYLKRDWVDAIGKFSEVIRISKKNGKAAELLIDRCSYYSMSPPSENWDGVFTRKTK
jgi:adenylate cyclase